MADNIVFNDFDVTVEIYDSVIAKWVLTDYSETDPSSTAYLRNRDLIQPKLSAGTNITISEDNEISADIRLDQMEQFISHDLKNELKLGTDQLLYVGFSGLLRNGGDVETRSELPDTSDPFIAHMIKDENLFVFAYQDSALGLVWLPLSFYVDMNLYVSKEELSPLVAPDIETHNLSEESHPFILNAIEEVRQEMADKEHFRGYYATTAEVLAISNPETGDFAYNAETGTKWAYDTDSWKDTLVPVPDQVTPPSDANPLMGGVASPGVSNQYSRGDHVHPSDISRVPTSRKINGFDLTADRNLTAENVGASPTVHTSTSQTYGAATASLFGHVRFPNSLPLMDGVADSGSVNDGVAAAFDHVHPSDTSKANVTDLQNATTARTLDAGFATFDPAVLGDVSAEAVGNSQLLITFTPVADITPADTPFTVFSGADASILPTLRLRFGTVWDYAEVEQVGFCVFDQDGDLTINAVATLFAGTPYTLLV